MHQVHHEPSRLRFVLTVEGTEQGELTYTVDEVIHANRTFVDPSLRGQGGAARLVKALIAWASETERTIDPRCSFVAVYLDRHPEHGHLRAA